VRGGQSRREGLLEGGQIKFNEEQEIKITEIVNKVGYQVEAIASNVWC